MKKNLKQARGRRSMKPAVLAVVTAAVLGGCTVAPKSLTMQERFDALADDRTNMFQDQEPIAGTITLEEAMARALKYNLDHRLKLMEDTMAQRQLDFSHYEMLPKLTAAAGYTHRDEWNASSSMDIVTRQTSLVPSTSQDRSRSTADLGFSWNILDFGVSYYQAHQSANRVLVAQERRRKVVQNLMQQVRFAYWRAVGAQQLADKVGPLLNIAEAALEDARKIEKARLQPPLESLRYQKGLLEVIRQLEGLRDELVQAKPQLAALMNMRPGEQYTLSVPEKLNVPQMAISLEKMEEQALLNRPELLEARYQERISVLDTKKALARMLPGLEINLGSYFDSNSFLVHEQWNEGALRVSWNLLNLLSAPSALDAAEAQEDVSRAQLMALNMAVLSQVHVANQEYQAAKRQFMHSDELSSIDQRIYQQVKRSVASSAENRMEEIRTAIAALMGELQRYRSYASLQNAYGHIEATLGHDPLPATVDSHSIEGLSTAIKQHLSQR